MTIAARWVTLVCSQMLGSSPPPVPSPFRSSCSGSPFCRLRVGSCQSGLEDSNIPFRRTHGKLCREAGPPNDNAVPPMRQGTPLAMIILTLPFPNQKGVNRFYVREAYLVEQKNPDANNKSFPSRTGPDCPLIVLICLVRLHFKSVLKSVQGN